MALSGSFYTNVASRWRLQLEWSASQSISGNYSDVTARLYWIALDGYGAVYSSATKTCSITIDGSSSSKSESGMAKLSGNQKKQIHSYTKRINHNSDGTKSFSLSAWFDAQVTLDGTYYNRISLSSRSFTLNTIPRASSITSSADWTAGNSRSVTISRASSSFTHTVRWQVKNSSGSWITIKTATGVGTSHSGGFSVAENTEIFKALAQRGSTDSRIELVTYSGGTQIGSTVYKTGKVTAPTPSTLTYASNFNIGQTAGFSIWRANNSFKHTLTVKFGNFSKTIASNFDTSASWNTSSDANNLYAQIPNSNYGTGTYELTTYYNGVKVQFTRSYTFTLNVVNSNPNFTSNFKYADINSTTKNITGNDQYIIQNNSNVRVTIPVANRATAKNHATMVRYEATLNGITKTANWSDKSDVIIDFGTVNADNNVTLTVKAIDSRGNSTSVSKTVTIVPYSMPTANFTAERVNNFESQTVLKLSGRISPLTINSSNKNSIVTARYRYKKSKDNTYGSWQNFSVSGVPNYTASNINLNLDNLESWDIQVEVTDKLGTVIVTRNVPVGKPIFFIDADKKSVGVNKLPEHNGSFEVGDKLIVDGDLSVDGNLSVDGYLSVGRILPNIIPANADLNDYFSAGFYYVPYNNNAETIKNCPTNMAFTLTCYRHAGTKQVLTEYMTSGQRTWTRNYYNGSWGEWKEEIHVEWWGRNSNGTAIKYSNGIMVCFHYQNYTPNWTQRNNVGGLTLWFNSTQWYFPASFRDVDSTYVFVSGDVGIFGQESYIAWRRDASSANIETTINVDPTGVNVKRSLFAIGFWR